MSDLQNRIDWLELRGLESRLIADLATDPEARLYNTSLARELMDQAAMLRRQLPASPEPSALSPSQEPRLSGGVVRT